MNNNIFIRTLTCFILTFCIHNSWGQIYDKEQAHPQLQWRQIEGDNFQLIFPAAFQNSALELAQELDIFIARNAIDLKVKPRKISIIVQADHVSQNGYVQLAPRKSELFSTPSSIADNQAWLSNLALHESRHIAQFDKLTGRLSKPFFEQLALALFGVQLPAWYFEGDAVLSETRWSNGGRGRMPSWEMPIRANVLAGKNYNFNKYVHGSFKDKVPSYYTIGYLLNSYITNHFGVETHEKIAAQVSKNILRPRAFSRALRQYTNLNSTDIFQHTMAELAEKWRAEKPDSSSPQRPIELGPERYATDYLMPQMTANEVLYMLKISAQKRPQIVRLADRKEHHITYTGQQLDPYFEVRGNLIVWDEYRKHSRFAKQSYSVINVYNTDTKQHKTLTQKSRYYSPTLHPELQIIACVEVDMDNNSRLVFLNSSDGTRLSHIDMPRGIHIQQPKYHPDGTKIIALAVHHKGTSILEFDLQNNTFKTRTNWSNQQLERPTYLHQDIIFKAHYTGIDNLYKLDTTGQIHSLTQDSIGAFNPFVWKNKDLYYNTYTYMGFKPTVQSIKNLAPEFIENKALRKPYLKLLEASAVAEIEPISDTTRYPVSNYKPLKHLLNFHSLSVSSSNFDNFENYKPGIFWFSNDILNTTQARIGYEYDTETAKSTYSASLSYHKYYPKFTLNYNNSGNLGYAVDPNNNNQSTRFDWRENYASLEMQLPFSIYRLNKVYSFGLNVASSYSQRYNLSKDVKNFNHKVAFPMSYQLYFNKNSLMSTMDIVPRWGQSLSVSYRHMPFSSLQQGTALALRSTIYTPGLWLNHSLQLRLSYQYTSGLYRFQQDIPMVAGWGNFNSPKVKNTLKVNYRFPLLHPDWSIGSMAYIKRITAMLLSDFQNIHNDQAPKTFGLGISTELNIFKYVLPNINVGTSLIYINDATATQKIMPIFSLSYTY